MLGFGGMVLPMGPLDVKNQKNVYVYTQKYEHTYRKGFHTHIYMANRSVAILPILV